jgi:hypothetical protein
VRSVGYFAKLFFRWAIVTLSVSIALFLAAGSTQLSSLRNYLLGLSALLLATMFGVDPGLAEERSRPVEEETTPDRFSVPRNPAACGLRRRAHASIQLRLG